MQSNPYLTSGEAADYLKIKERKLYELVATGAIPCSKVTGKWLFPRVALDRWIEAGLAMPAGFAAASPPPIIGGSNDLLLEWAARRSRCGLALLSEGSEAGLNRLERNEIAIAAIHLHGEGDNEAANVDAVAAREGLYDAVVVAFASREQGLILASGNPLGVSTLDDAKRSGARFGLRQKGAGAQLLLARLLAEHGVALSDLKASENAYATGQDLALAVTAGEIDCGLATRGVAATQGLAFVPLAWERFDLVMRRRTYFEPGPQALFTLMRSPEFARQARNFTGYTVNEAGAVRLNR